MRATEDAMRKLLLVASIRTILAFGAIACAHCTSSEVSCAQPESAFGIPLVDPFWFTFVRKLDANP